MRATLTREPRTLDPGPIVARPAAVNGTILLLMASTLGAGYLSSWVPSVLGFPAGAILRDALSFLLVGLAVVAILVPFGPSPTASILSVRNLLLFAVVPVAVHSLWRRDLVSARVVMTGFLVLGAIAAALGLADTMTAGGIVTALGFRRDFAALPQGEPPIISGAAGALGGIVRASGGISDALVFGYLMALVTLVGIWWSATLQATGASRRSAALTGLAAALAGAALIESLTRGALLAFGVALVILLILRPTRTMIVSAALSVGIAIVAVALMSSSIPLVATDSGSEGAAPSSPPAASQASAPAASSAAGNPGQIVIDRIGSDDPASQLSSQARLDQLKVGISTLADRPWGTGLGTEGAAADRAGAAAVKSTPDIYLMIVALQTGMPGIILWLSVAAVSAWWVVRHRSSPAASLTGAGIGLLAVASVLSHTPDAPPLSVFLWLLLLGLGAEAAQERLDSPGLGAQPEGRPLQADPDHR